MKKQIYLAGPLFTRGEIKDRLHDEEILRKHFKTAFEIFNPISWNKEQQIDAKFEGVTEYYIFKKDIDAIHKSEIMIVDIDNEDAGTLVELGIFIQMKKENPNLKLYAIYSNWKDKSIINKFVWGSLEAYANAICKDIEEVCEAIKQGK